MAGISFLLLLGVLTKKKRKMGKVRNAHSVESGECWWKGKGKGKGKSKSDK